MAITKKKIAFYSLLSSGHLNVCSSLATCLLNRYGNELEVYFIVDSQWANKLAKVDSRFKFGIFDYDDQEMMKLRMVNLVDKLKNSLELPLVQKLSDTWQGFIDDPLLLETDRKSEQQIREIKPDFVLSDQLWCLPAMIRTGIKFAFIVSCNPCLLSLDGFPQLGFPCRSDDAEQMKEFDKLFVPLKKTIRKKLLKVFEQRDCIYDRDIKVDQPLSDHFTIYCYPKEVDYFSNEIKQKYRLLQIDTPLYADKIPKPFVLVGVCSLSRHYESNLISSLIEQAQSNYSALS